MKQCITVLVDYNGLIYVSQNGNCVYINKTQEKLTPRCNLCNKAEFLGSDYFGAENNKLHFDSYFVKLELTISSKTLWNDEQYLSTFNIVCNL